MFNLVSWRNFKAIVVSFLGLLLTFGDDIFGGNVAWRVSRMPQLLPLFCGTETGLPPSVLAYFYCRWMELSTKM